MQRWEHWYTDPELSAQLRREAGEETEAGVQGSLPASGSPKQAEPGTDENSMEVTTVSPKKASAATRYQIDSEIREAAKERIRELWDSEE